MTIEQLCSVGNVPSQGVVKTPIEIVCSNIKSIPSYIMESSTTTFLEPGFGSGTFIFELIRELIKYGHSMENIQSRIYGFEITHGFTNQVKTNLSNYDFKNIHNGNFLTHDFKNMEFDQIIVNPPYHTPGKSSDHNKLWIQFLIKSRTLLKPNGYLTFITPSSYINTSRHGKKTLGVGLSDMNLIKYTDLGPAFPGVGIDVCTYTEQKKPYQGITDYNGKEVDLREGIPITGDKLIIKNIVDKVIHSDFPKHKLIFNWFEKTEFRDSGKQVFTSAYKTNFIQHDLPDEGKLKLVLPFSSSYKKQFITTNLVGYLNNYILLDSEEQGNNILSYTLSKLFILVANNFMKSSGFTPFARNKNIPLLDNKHWVDSELYSLFNLTQDEIDFVEKNHK